jgi:hypothetical protein
MIAIQQFSEPSDFFARVYNPGQLFLKLTPFPTNAQFRKAAHWTRAHDSLYQLYNGVCSYCASWMPRTGTSHYFSFSSVDHMLPKSMYPQLAYTWDNLRLARQDLNENKDADCEIVDPAFINGDWFQIDFLTCRIRAANDLNGILKSRIAHTIRVLQFNLSPLIDERTSVIGDFSHNRFDLQYLQKFYPFLAKETIRQNFDLNYRVQLQSVHP